MNRNVVAVTGDIISRNLDKQWIPDLFQTEFVLRASFLQMIRELKVTFLNLFDPKQPIRFCGKVAGHFFGVVSSITFNLALPASRASGGMHSDKPTPKRVP